VIAHAGGLPVEEVLPVLVSGGGAWLLLWRTSLGARLRSTRHPSTGGRGAGGDVARHGPDSS
jgi:hypothetical protein